MIFVTRTLPPPARLDLLQATSAASLELAAIKLGLDANGHPAAETSFSAYSHLTVRDALRDMFHNKCAYCESLIAGSQDTDIEHFRPKGRVTEAEGLGISHPGYWWLAMDWSNLVLSCVHCNQIRRQILMHPGMTEEEIVAAIDAENTVLAGKLDSFPTEDNQWITDHTADTASEKPLLLDPTARNPEEHLEWVLGGTISTVKARDRSLAGETSIRTYALNRRRLTEDRMTRLLILRLMGNKVIALVNRATAEPNDHVAAVLKEMAAAQVQILKAHCTDDQPYAAMSREYVNDLTAQIASIMP